MSFRPLLLTLICSISAKGSKRELRYINLGKIVQKPLNLPSEMIEIETGNKTKVSKDLFFGHQYPVDFKEKSSNQGSRRKNEFSEDLEYMNDLGAKMKGPGVESRWRYRLTACQKTGTCPCGSHQEIAANPFGSEGSIYSNPNDAKENF